MKNFLITSIVILLSVHVGAQVAQNIVVEHFTNTRCGICANRNPGFYSNLENHPDVFHISFHPSSPYSNCVLNNHNTAENDARTNFYNNYGSTPKFVVQGDKITGATDVSKPALFTPYDGMMSPIELKINQHISVDSIHSDVVVKTVASHSLGTVKLFVAVAEDTVFYNAPNGENEHYDVFRKAMTDIVGNDLTVPVNIGDSVVLTFSLALDAEWDVNQLITVGILQDGSDKSVIQASATEAENVGTPVAIREYNDLRLQWFPNPTSGVITVTSMPSGTKYFRLYNQVGQLVYRERLENTDMSTIHLPSDLENGIYLVHVVHQESTFSSRLLLQR